MLPVFADPKTDVVFKRIFGAEARKPLLIALLNDLLELKGPQRIRDLHHLSLEQHVAVPEMKLSIVDVKCTTAGGRRFVVEMQVAKVKGIDKRIVYNASKAYVMQLRSAEKYPALCNVVGVTICNFALWPKKDENDRHHVPMLSRWRMQEQHSKTIGLPHVQFVFLELPKYAAGEDPRTMVDKWAYFFREANDLELVPPALAEAPFHEALDVARTATFTPEEWEAYERAKMAEQDARGALWVARREARREGKDEGRVEGMAEGLAEGRVAGLVEGIAEGIEKGIAEGIAEGIEKGLAEGIAEGRKSGLAEGELKGKREALLRLLMRAGITLTEGERARIQACTDAALLDRWVDNVLGANTAADVLS